MGYSENELESLIKKVTAEIVSNTIKQLPQIDNLCQTLKPKNKGLLLIISDMAMNLHNLIKYAESRYTGYEMTIASFKTNGAINTAYSKEVYNLNDLSVQEKLSNTIGEFEEICFLAPGLKQMEAVVDGNDSGYFESLVFYSLLHKKKTVFLLDYEVDKLPSNNFVKKVKSLQGSITEMGISFGILGQDAEVKAEAPIKHKKLITQKEVEDIYKSGTKDIFCEKGCIITPLAKDRAKELGVNFVQM